MFRVYGSSYCYTISGMYYELVLPHHLMTSKGVLVLLIKVNLIEVQNQYTAFYTASRRYYGQRSRMIQVRRTNTHRALSDMCIGRVLECLNVAGPSSCGDFGSGLHNNISWLLSNFGLNMVKALTAMDADIHSAIAPILDQIHKTSYPAQNLEFTRCRMWRVPQSP